MVGEYLIDQFGVERVKALIPADVGVTLGQRRRRCANFNPTLCGRLVLAVIAERLVFAGSSITQ